ncbi:down syndrome cell adhesion molecule-like protein Dscam2 [Nephila pilipes]|uniref:Down syndrome cell adhesion molecule-like protein Dscam2 n=1 Tax=Nephila pilipes TaxID=299642 RepID=A0A8X6PQ25_NEPPI|nr:down syndrome cell adhesion molecule-like protein Dscam2 [Nephila pilipes]
MRWKRGKRRTLWSGVKRRLVKEKSKLRPGLQKLEWKRVKKRLHKEWKTRRTSLVQWVDRFFRSFINDVPREDQQDLLTLARAEAANNVYEIHLENKQRFDLHRRSHSFSAGDLVLYDWPKKRRSQIFSHFQRTLCDCTFSRGRMLRDQVYDTAEQIYKGCPRTTSSPLL